MGSPKLTTIGDKLGKYVREEGWWREGERQGMVYAGVSSVFWGFRSHLGNDAKEIACDTRFRTACSGPAIILSTKFPVTGLLQIQMTSSSTCDWAI